MVSVRRRFARATIGAAAGALAETVTLAADDVLLDDLLARLEAEPLARELLIGASVYREPVDEVGLQWQVSEVMEATNGRPPPAPHGVATARELLEDLSLSSAQRLGRKRPKERA